jgi:hypothetical protein
MNSRQARCDVPECGARANPWLVFIALLALAVQLFVVQTHVHGAVFESATNSQSASISIDGVAADKPAHPDGFPVNDDPSNCPLCQAFAHSGALLHATQIPGWVPVFTIEAASYFSATFEPDLRVSRSWFGRAPPLPAVQS